MKFYYLLFFVLLIPLSLGDTLQIDGFTVRGEDIELSNIENTVNFGTSEITILGITDQITVTGMRGKVNGDGVITAVVEGEEGVLTIEKSTEDSDINEIKEYKFSNGASISYSIIDESLEISDSIFLIDGLEVDVAGSLSVVGNTYTPNGIVYLPGFGGIDSPFQVRRDGILLLEGNEEIDLGLEFERVLLSEGNVLINTGDFENIGADYNGAYLSLAEDSIIMQGAQGTTFSYLTLEGNSVLDVKSFREEAKFTLEDGGRVEAVSRVEDNKIPLVTISESVAVTVVNGELTLSQGGIISSDPEFPTEGTLREIISTRRSVPLTVVRDEKTNYIFTPTNSLYVEVDGVTVASINDYELPVTEDLSQNRVRTLDDLKAVYPEFPFDTLEENPDEYVPFEPSPASIQAVYYWLQENPEPHIEKIFFSDSESTYIHSGDNRLVFGDTLFNSPSILGELQVIHGTDREYLGRPLQLLDHEDTHLLINSLDPTVQEVYNLIASTTRGQIELDPTYTRLRESVLGQIRDYPDDIVEPTSHKEFAFSTWTEEDVDTHGPYGLYLFCSQNRDLTPENAECAAQMQALAYEKGLPSIYALRNYGDGRNQDYKEVASVFVEEPLEQIKERAQRGNRAQQESYYTLTQIAYDSGQIDKATCEEILEGNIHFAILVEDREQNGCIKGVLWR